MVKIIRKREIFGKFSTYFVTIEFGPSHPPPGMLSARTFSARQIGKRQEDEMVNKRAFLGENLKMQGNIKRKAFVSPHFDYPPW